MFGFFKKKNNDTQIIETQLNQLMDSVKKQTKFHKQIIKELEIAKEKTKEDFQKLTKEKEELKNKIEDLKGQLRQIRNHSNEIANDVYHDGRRLNKYIFMHWFSMYYRQEKRNITYPEMVNPDFLPFYKICEIDLLIKELQEEKLIDFIPGPIKTDDVFFMPKQKIKKPKKEEEFQ